jgi:hypothetical protein
MQEPRSPAVKLAGPCIGSDPRHFDVITTTIVLLEGPND